MLDVCVACGGQASFRHGLPVANGEVVENDFTGEWGGAAACISCYEVHQAGGVAALDVYLRAIRRREAKASHA